MFKMALESYLDSNFQCEAPSVAPSEGFLQPSNSYNSKEEHGQHQASIWNPCNGNLPSTIFRAVDLNDTYPTTGLNAGARSLVSDSKFSFSEGSLVHSTANTSSDLDVLALSASFPSRNLKVSYESPKRPQMHNGIEQELDARTLEQLRCSLSGEKRELLNSTRRHKRPKLDVKEENVLDQHIPQQLLQGENSVQLQRHTPLLHSLVLQDLLQNQSQQKVSLSVPLLQGVHIPPQQQQIRNQLPQQVEHGVCNIDQLGEVACFRRLMQYIYHIRQRPHHNELAYWRKFVAEFYAPGAKKRWCVSSYDKGGLEGIAPLPHAAMGSWHCDLCGCRSSRGYEASFEVIPRLNKLTFECGVVDELLFLDLPQVCKFSSGGMMLEYDKAVQESVYEHLRVVHKGQLRIVFTQDLKILSWEFCASCHEVFVPRKLAASQMLNVMHEYQIFINHGGRDGVFPQDFRNNIYRVQPAGCWPGNADIDVVDDIGFPRRYTQCLQIAEVVDSMKNLMTFWQTKQLGPIESLKNYTQEIAKAGLQKGEVQGKQKLKCQDFPMDKQNLIPMSPGAITNANNSSNMAIERPTTGSEQVASGPPGYDHKLSPEALSSRAANNFPVYESSNLSSRAQVSEQSMKILEEFVNNNTTLNGAKKRTSKSRGAFQP
ncbi:hypothetical protein UlMin_002317 [Ulmus minor]